MLPSVFYLLLSSTSVDAHSWIHCTDYRGSPDYYDSNQCFGHPRPWARGGNQNDMVVPSQVGFGEDQGMNRQLEKGELPDGECHSLEANQFAGGNFPMATYKRGQEITLAWPAKNHVPEFCDGNPGGAGLPDTFNGLFMERASPSVSVRFNKEVVFEPMSEGNTHVRNQVDYKGFGKCPKFCENRDKALCTGSFVVPDVPDGKYSFSWRWTFNPGETYVTCFDAQVQGEEIAPITGDTWQDGGVGMFVERNKGCHEYPTEDDCLGWADGRDGRVGQRCGWCCGETCDQQGGPGYEGGPNRCEPVNWLETNNIARFKTTGTDSCSPPTVAPTSEPTTPPTTAPVDPVVEPEPVPVPATNPGNSLMPPSPGTGAVPGAVPAAVPQVPGLGAAAPATATQCAPVMGQCGGVGMAAPICCAAGSTCVPVTAMFLQCQPAQLQANNTSGGGTDMNVVLILIAVFFCLAVCCGVVIVWKFFIKSDSDDSYRKHNSLSDERSRRSDRDEDRDSRDRRRKKKKSRRSRDDSRSRTPTRRSKESKTRGHTGRSNTDSWIED